MPNIHFIAIGGNVMHQLAITLAKKGYTITGSDDEIFEPALFNLKAAGLLPNALGWFPLKITNNLDAVVAGMHAREDNPELMQAKTLGIPIYSFPEFIFNESRNKKRVVIGGSHGKTTTTAMIMHVLQQQQLKFDYLIGAQLNGFEQSVQLTNAPVIVCEGDEYPASALDKRPKFHFLFPHIAVITGIAWDHINVFPTFEIYKTQFEIFISKIEQHGILIYNAADAVLKDLVEKHPRNDIQYIPYILPEHEVKDGITYITIEGITTPLKVFGNHNLFNLNAAYFVCKVLGVNAAAFLAAMCSFTGASKRLEVIMQTDAVTIFRDFAHAPSKVKATIEAVKQQYPNRHLTAVFELHTYSSLNASFFKEYQGVFQMADSCAVFYAEHALAIKKMPLINEALLREGFAKPEVCIFHNKEALQNWLYQQPKHHVNILLMSSGNFDGLNLDELQKAFN
ncbi:MAG: peptidoglycan synthetase [Sphingobacteriales bacterium]|uniref:UDP-N-acetylmuramate--L-alanine ligase n=1 Tax=Hydrotalea flava TaxID=714549 RepID=UPI0008307278|nr:Mur ligase family protein [Hydrotalea flava]RTL48266.1 MAG: peptidoglycan synthetase [Sphingobacteriales bacterium]